MAMPAVTTPIVSVEGAVPEVADRVTQFCVFAAAQFMVPVPVFMILTAWDAGSVAPTTFANPSEVRDKLRTGDDGGTGVAAARISVTLTVLGDPVAPEELTVTVSV